MLYVPYLKVNILSISSFKYERYAIAFWDKQVLVYSKEATQDKTIMIGIRKERLYRLLVRPIIRSNGYFDSTSDSYSLSEAFSETRSCETPSSINGTMSP
jgi:hypothetical protein